MIDSVLFFFVVNENRLLYIHERLTIAVDIVLSPLLGVTFHSFIHFSCLCE